MNSSSLWYPRFSDWTILEEKIIKMFTPIQCVPGDQVQSKNLHDQTLSLWTWTPQAVVSGSASKSLPNTFCSGIKTVAVAMYMCGGLGKPATWSKFKILSSLHQLKVY
jgi:hypothetical protein